MNILTLLIVVPVLTMAGILFTKDMKKRLREQIVDADFEFLHMNNDIHCSTMKSVTLLIIEHSIIF